MLLNVIRKFIKPSDVIWDVGGNVGFFALASVIKSQGGRVCIFEPDLTLTYLLRKTADANPDLNIDIVPIAVSDKNGSATLNIAQRARSTNYLDLAKGSTQTGGVKTTQRVPTTSLDWALNNYPSPNFLKIDVEGAEYLTLQGATDVLSKARPIVLCEVFSDNCASVCELLVTSGYRLFDAERVPEFQPFVTTSQNILAIPE